MLRQAGLPNFSGGVWSLDGLRRDVDRPRPRLGSLTSGAHHLDRHRPVSPAGSRTLYVAVCGKGVYKSTNGERILGRLPTPALARRQHERVDAQAHAGRHALLRAHLCDTGGGGTPAGCTSRPTRAHRGRWSTPSRSSRTSTASTWTPTTRTRSTSPVSDELQSAPRASTDDHGGANMVERVFDRLRHDGRRHRP